MALPIVVPASPPVPSPFAVLATAPSLKHHTQSTKDDGLDSTFIQPSDWNEEHDLNLPASCVVGRDPTGAGPAQCLPLDFETGDPMNMPTSAHVQAMINAAIAALPVDFVTGDFCASVAATKANWLLANGQSIGNVGSGATFSDAKAKNLFLLLWGLNANTWPVLPARGTGTALDDWNGNKTVKVPDARGCVLGMVDLASGVNVLITGLGLKFGLFDKELVVANLPPHTHPLPDPLQISSTGSGGFVGSGNPVVWNSAMTPKATTGSTGGALNTAVPPVMEAVPVGRTQPTLGSNIFIRL